MKGKRFFRRLRGLVGREKRVKNEQKPNINDSVIVHHTQGRDGQSTEAPLGEKASVDELRATADPQTQAFIFNLPLEIRFKIYHEVWREYLKPRRVSPCHPGSDLRLHLYTPSSASTRLMHTRCILHSADPAQEDSFVTRPWPFDNYGNLPTAPPPRWFFEAWVLRLNWGKHWKCQDAVQRRWDPLTGRGSHRQPRDELPPFLPLFLACKTMYLEAAQSFFETVTLVFTSSLDAHNFLLQQPQHRHRLLPHLRHLELSFTHTNDHLYLTEIPPPPATADSNDPSPPPTTTTATPSESAAITTTPSESAATTTTVGSNSHVCFNTPCRISMFGPSLWQTLLLQGVRSTAPKLLDLDINIGGRIRRNMILDLFGTVEEDEEEEEGSVSNLNSEGGASNGSGKGEVWEVPGKLKVGFAFGGRGYVQVGGRMVRVEGEGVAV